MPRAHYSADLVAGSLLVSESRKIAHLLLQEIPREKISEIVLKENLLQKRSPKTAKRQSQTILNRLYLLSEPFWRMVRDGSHEQAVQVLLCAAIKNNLLLGDFIGGVVSSHIKTFKKELALRDWDVFFEQGQGIDPSIGAWSESTRRKVREVSFRILAEAGIIDTTRSKRIQPFLLLGEVRTLLEENHEDYILHCLEVFK